MYKNYVGKPNFKNAKRINSKLVGVEMKYSSIKINKPFYIGMSILDLSKWHMYNFHYNVMKAIFGDRVHLLYMDMDSFIYKISSADVYEELRPHSRDYFDFSKKDISKAEVRVAKGVQKSVIFNDLRFPPI